MLGAHTSASDRRKALRAGLSSGRLLRFPGAFNALSALLIEQLGFEGLYVSGAVVSAGLGLPDIGLTSVGEVAGFAQAVTRVSGLPCLADADTGFGEPMNVARTIQLFEEAGVAGCHLEDQVMPKRCGHLEGKTVVGVETMRQRLAAALGARRDPDFLICARTDAVAVEGLAAGVERAKVYADAGAEMIFAEAVESPAQLEAFRNAVEVPILANMTEFGRSPLLTTAQLEAIGVNVVIYPVTLLRLAMGAVEAGLRQLGETGTQAGLLETMQTRARLYEVLDYRAYNVFDELLFNFETPTGTEEGRTDDR